MLNKTLLTKIFFDAEDNFCAIKLTAEEKRKSLVF